MIEPPKRLRVDATGKIMRITFDRNQPGLNLARLTFLMRAFSHQPQEPC